MKPAFDILGYSYEAMLNLFAARYQKKEYHAKAFFSALYRLGGADAQMLPEFQQNQALAARLAADFPLRLPKPEQIQDDGQNIKFSLNFADGAFAETVIIGMKSYDTLCLSSQTGCKWGCAFCSTGKLGFARNLSAAEIVAQYMAARFIFGRKIENLVFMGMGEPLDNFDNVKTAIDILADQRGARISPGFMNISTVGSVENIKKLHALIAMDNERAKEPPRGCCPPTAYRNLKLAVSLNAPNDATRSLLMPANRRWPMQELKEALQAIPLKRKYHDLFIEYILIPGLTDDAKALCAYLKDLPCVVNVIPYNTGLDNRFAAPSESQVSAFMRQLIAAGQPCRLRRSRGAAILAACGQLGALRVPS